MKDGSCKAALKALLLKLNFILNLFYSILNLSSKDCPMGSWTMAWSSKSSAL